MALRQSLNQCQEKIRELQRDNTILRNTTWIYALYMVIHTELGTLEWWISGLMFDLIFFLISRLNNACSPVVFNLQIN